MKFLRDLFCGVGNEHWDLARIMAAWAVISYSGGFIYALARGQTIEWSSLGTGFGAVLLGAGALIGIKDFAKAKVEAVASVAAAEVAVTEAK